MARYERGLGDAGGRGRSLRRVAGGTPDHVAGVARQELKIIDVSVPANLRVVGQHIGGRVPTGDSRAADLAVSDQYAYVAATDAGLQVVNLSDPARPQLAGWYQTIGLTTKVAVSGHHACLIDTDCHPCGLVKVIDISDASHPRLLSTYAAIGEAAVAVSGDYFYVVSDLGFEVVDISAPTAPHQVAEIPSVGSGHDIVVSGQYAYITETSGLGLQVVDVSQPTDPKHVGNYVSSQGVSGVAVAGSYAYIAEGSEMAVISVSEPTNLRKVGAYQTTFGQPVAVAVSGDYAYVQCYGGMLGIGQLEVIDVSDPSKPRRLGSVRSDGGVRRIATAGGYVYVANSGGSGGPQVIDVSDPANPQCVGRYQLEPNFL